MATEKPYVQALVRQTSTTLKAAAAQYSLAGPGCHTLQKAMDACTVALLWLVRSFWHTVLILQDTHHNSEPPCPLLIIMCQSSYCIVALLQADVGA